MKYFDCIVCSLLLLLINTNSVKAKRLKAISKVDLSSWKQYFYVSEDSRGLSQLGKPAQSVNSLFKPKKKHIQNSTAGWKSFFVYLGFSGKRTTINAREAIIAREHFHSFKDDFKNNVPAFFATLTDIEARLAVRAFPDLFSDFNARDQAQILIQRIDAFQKEDGKMDIDDLHCRYLSYKQLKFFMRRNLKTFNFLRGTCLRNIDPLNLKALDASVMEYLVDAAFDVFHPTQVAALNPLMFATMRKRHFVALIQVSDCRHFNQNQIYFMSPYLFQHMDSNCLKNMVQSEEFLHILRPEQLQLMDSKFCSLDEWDIELVQSKAWITLECLSNMNPAKLSQMSVETLKALNPAFISVLGNEQVNALSHLQPYFSELNSRYL